MTTATSATRLLFLIAIFFAVNSSSAAGDLGPNQVFKSERLGYDLHYRAYTPDGYQDMDDLPVMYVTDGQWYISEGRLVETMDKLIADKVIEPAVVIFIDNRDPYDYNVNRRNSQFFCNKDYIHFVTKELVPFVDTKFGTSTDREDRVILGLSFGGLNSACFGLFANSTFRGIAMQSPAMHPLPDIVSQYATLEQTDLKIFLSTGTKRDNEERTRQFRDVLENIDVELEYVEVPHGHNWQNWQPLIDDILIYYFGR